MGNSVILGTGSYLPEQVITNEVLAARLGLTSIDLFRRTGIRERRRAADKEATSDLATRAAEKALIAAGITPQDVDLIIVATTSPDMLFPSTACLVQRNLGAPRTAAFDVHASCAGFLYALQIADAFLTTGTLKKALVIAAEVKSRFVDPADPETGYLFGDGAGAVVIAPVAEKTNGRGILWSQLHADGSKNSWIQLPAGGSRQPASPITLREGLHTMRLSGGPVFRAAVRGLESTLREGLHATGLRLDQIHHFFFHQANARILKKVARDLAIPTAKIPETLSMYGNTSSASIPITLDAFAQSGRLHQGDILFLGTFGGGLTWGGGLIRW